MGDENSKLKAAVEHLGKGEAAQARSLCEAVLSDEPENARAWHLTGITYAQAHELEQAVECFEKATKCDDSSANYFYNLGLAYRGLNRFEDAIVAYRNAVDRKPNFREAQNNLANTLVGNGDMKGAIECFRDLLTKFPDDAVTHYNLGNVLQDNGEFRESVASLRQAVKIDPDLASARENLGRALSDVRLYDEAKEVWNEWLAHEPGNPIAAHMLASLTGKGVPSRCNDEFVRGTFDVAFADSFDQQLAKLDYRGPQLMQEAVELLDENHRQSVDILDAGCGTGLSAPFLRPLAKRLVGVDLSPDMLVKAGQRQLYDDLVEDELTRFFESRPDAFDLVLCSDTLCYFGDLESALAGAIGCLRDGGYFVFSVERVAPASEAETEPPVDDENQNSNSQDTDGPDTEGEAKAKTACTENDDDIANIEKFELQPNGRYRHVESYVTACVEQAGFVIQRCEHAMLRLERGRKVLGLVVTARAKE